MKPAQLHIIDLIGEKLLNISKMNGYNFDIEKIKREKISNFTGKEMPIIFYWSENDSKIQNRTGREQRRISIFVAGFFKTADNIFNDESYKFGSDIYNAIHRSKDSPNVIDSIEHDLGCEFVDLIDVVDIAPIIGVGQTPYAGIMVNLSVEYSIKPGLMTFENCI